MILDVRDDRILLQDVPLRVNENMQTIMGARHVLGTDDWTAPCSWVAVHQIADALRHVDYQTTDAFDTWLREEQASVEYTYEIQIASDWPGNAKLVPLQRVASEFLKYGKRRICAYDLGGGKTPIACDALSSTGSQAILIVCPKSVFQSWKKHVYEWTSDITPIVASDTAGGRKKGISEAVKLLKAGRRVALIMNYESVWRHTRLSPYGNLRMEKCLQCDRTQHPDEAVTPAKCETHEKELNEVHWDTIIFDEAHRIINVSKQTRGCWYLSKHAEYVWALTGTPSRGSVADFWSLLRLCDPDAWPSRTKCVDRYFLSGQDGWGNTQVFGLNPTRKDEWEQVTSQYMIRRSFDEIMRGWAESKGEEYREIKVLKEERMVELTRAQRGLYNDLTERIFAETPDGKVIYADNGLTELTRCLQLASAMLDVSDDDPSSVRMVSPSPKVDELVRIMSDLQDEQVVVFVTNRDLATLAQERLEKEGYRCVKVTGDVLDEDRDNAVEQFQEGAAQVIVLTYAAGSEGITLTAGHITVRLQLHWSMILNKQAEGRTLRYGQASDHVVYIDVMGSDTVESRVWEAYGDNLDQLELVVQDAKRMKELVHGK